MQEPRLTMMDPSGVTSLSLKLIDRSRIDYSRLSRRSTHICRAYMSCLVGGQLVVLWFNSYEAVKHLFVKSGRILDLAHQHPVTFFPSINDGRRPKRTTSHITTVLCNSVSFTSQSRRLFYHILSVSELKYVVDLLHRFAG